MKGTGENNGNKLGITC